MIRDSFANDPSLVFNKENICTKQADPLFQVDKKNYVTKRNQGTFRIDKNVQSILK